MYQTFYQQKKPFYIRFTALIAVFVIVLCVFGARLFDIQVVNADSYRAQANNTSTRTLTVTATRGEIVDRYGRTLVYNRDGFNIVFDAAQTVSSDINRTVLRMIKLLQQHSTEWVDDMPMSDGFPCTFTEDSDTEVSLMRRNLGLARYATAQNCFDAMVKRYSLEGYSEDLQRLIMGVRYTMELSDFSTVNPFVFAEDIDKELAGLIEEYSDDLPGVTVQQSTFREYTDPTLAPHILGYIGLMSAEEWQKVKESGNYKYSDKIGKDGIEKYAQDELRGQNGIYTVIQNADGSVRSVETVRDPVPGNTVQLTIDSKLQKVTQDALARAISNINNSPDSKGTATGGAVVVTNIKDGGVLASANYPTYGMDEFLNDYQSVVSRSNNPLFDRALQGQYPPGSTFKPAVALIGLQLGKISVNETIRCTHKYTRFEDYQPSCLGWHGSVNVSRALAKSCNYFFFELGYRIGISDLNKFCKQLGLGVDTGIELRATSGILAGKEYREKINQIWNQGDTIQAAIGQSDNAFSPLQLAMYTSTIANGGTRYKAHFINSIYNYSLTEVVKSNFTEVLGTTEISPENYESVKEGMLQVTEDGTASATFSKYPIKVAGKTGTADAPGKTNAVFIAFAPYDDPEIAISIIIENGGHGSAIAPVAKEIFDAYFYNSNSPYIPQETGKLIG